MTLLEALRGARGGTAIDRAGSSKFWIDRLSASVRKLPLVSDDALNSHLLDVSAESLLATGWVEAPSAVDSVPETIRLRGGLVGSLHLRSDDGESAAEFLELRDAQGRRVYVFGDTALLELAVTLPINLASLYLLKAASACVETGLPFVAPTAPILQGATSGARMCEAATYFVGRLNTANVAGTCSGSLACAWAVNYVAKIAIGSPIGGETSTDRMYEALRSGRGTEITDQAMVAPGDVIISPTEGDRHGHVGIVGQDGWIYSNSSLTRQWSRNYTLERWLAYFRNQRGLAIEFYRL